MKAGTIIKLPDNRIGTVVYNGLDGEGIAFGRHELPENFMEDAIKAWGQENFGDGNASRPTIPICEALLREPFKWQDMECVGTKFKIIWEPEEK